MPPSGCRGRSKYGPRFACWSGGEMACLTDAKAAGPKIARESLDRFRGRTPKSVERTMCGTCFFLNAPLPHAKQIECSLFFLAVRIARRSPSRCCKTREHARRVAPIQPLYHGDTGDTVRCRGCWTVARLFPCCSGTAGFDDSPAPFRSLKNLKQVDCFKAPLSRVEAIASRAEAFACKVEAIAPR